MSAFLRWSELTGRLEALQKEGWSWCTGYAHGGYYVSLWKNKKGIQKLSWTAKQGRHVVSELGSSPEDALTKALSRHGESTFDPDPPSVPPWLEAQRKLRESHLDGQKKHNPIDPSLPETPEAPPHL